MSKRRIAGPLLLGISRSKLPGVVFGHTSNGISGADLEGWGVQGVRTPLSNLRSVPFI